MYSKESEELLIKELRSGTNKAFEAMMNKYKQREFSDILKMFKDQDLDNDLFQEVFIKVKGFIFLIKSLFSIYFVPPVT